MQRFGVLLIFLATALSVPAEDWTTADGKTYRNVVVVDQEDDGVRITYTGGVGKIPYYELSLDLQKRFGEDYDSLVAKKLAAEKALADATREAQEAAEQKKQQDQAAAAQAQNNPQGANAPQATPPPAATILPSQPVVNPLPNPAEATAPPVSVHVEGQKISPRSKLSYDTNLDVCYLDSPSVAVQLITLESAPNAPAQVAALSLRVATEGSQPKTPDRIDATFLPEGTIKQLTGHPQVKFLVDGTYIPASEMDDDDGASGSEQSANCISFYLTPQQAKSIFHGEKVDFSVAGNDYRIDEIGLTTFRKYFEDIDQLPPASPNFIRSYHRFLNQLPSIVTMISTVCEYIILGSFAIVFFAAIAACVIGLLRFINM